MNKPLLIYISTLQNVFHVFNQKDIDATTKVCEDKPALIEGLKKMDSYRANWDKLTRSIKENILGKFRNTSLSGQRNSFKGLISYSDDTGVLFSISFPFEVYGFYYSKFVSQGSIFRTVNSFTPFDVETENRMLQLERLIKTNFPGFKSFDNSLAEYEINLICIDNFIHQKLILWQAIFTTNLHGII